jgi:hypothetical protein
MQGALRAATYKGIPDRETDGASLRLAALQRINASELKASYDSESHLSLLLLLRQLLCLKLPAVTGFK